MYRTLLFLFVLSVTNLAAQAPKKMTSGDIFESIQKLNVLGSVLYVAAHPDDENQRLISYMANHKKMNTAYLSLTRGDGGQNLIGPEIRELLGVIRTQELLAARRTDGGTQLFSRANDFGYSKHPDETLKIWNEKEVMADVIWAIRKWQPDVIVNRFDHRSPGRTHGHHTSSAMLSHQAFEMAGDPMVYPEQLKYLEVWQPQRLFFNTSWWFYGSRDKFAKADKSSMMAVDVGVYYPMKGKSNTEIAAEARSMHKCQGFGAMSSRGGTQEYLELLKGEMPTDKTDVFEGINTTWSRIEGGAPIGKLMNSIIEEYDYGNPSASVPNLVKAYKMIKALPNGHWKRVKLKEIKEVIKGALGLYIEAVADDYSYTPNQEIALDVELINRSDISVVAEFMSILPIEQDTMMTLNLLNNEANLLTKTITLPNDMPYTNPYWLNKKAALGMYTVEEQLMRGVPETPRALKIHLSLVVDGTPIDYSTDVVYKERDPVAGEVHRPVEIVPPVFGNIQEEVYVFASNDAKPVNILVKSGRENVKGKVTLARPNGWKIEPEFVDIDLKLKGEEQLVTFQLFPTSTQEENLISPIIELEDGTMHTRKATFIEYDHIPTQTIIQPSESKVVRVDLKKKGEKIGYIMGAGDAVPAALEQVGYQVTELKDGQIMTGDLSQYDAIILGVRAYNTVERMKFYQPKLMDYVQQGGTLINQYNTHRSLKVKMDKIAPYPIKISRDRVAVEEAEVRFLVPAHAVLNTPNKITQKDFEGWVQERGLYFPNEWDDHFTPILSSNDLGETPKDGGLLVAQYGDGWYVYSGYSWFRELPAGVPGAYRLFTNLISIGK